MEQVNLIFGGTSEGRELFSWMKERKMPVLLSVATDYGKEICTDFENDPAVLSGRLNAEEMGQLFSVQGIHRVIDATHPFAVEVSANIREACKQCNIPYIRLLRKNVEYPGALLCHSTAEAAELLKKEPGRILLTTGSKELSTFTGVPGFTERFYVRVLPSEESLHLCHEAGLPGSHIQAMQGPFSEKWNRLLIREWKIDLLVTKASGTRGGFEEKISAAQKERIRVLVIVRPEEEGLSFEQILKMLVEETV